MFDDPFFTDEGYMEKKMKKADRIFTTVAIVGIVLTFLYFSIILFAVNSASQEIEKQGGLGTSIGKFINSINKEIE